MVANGVELIWHWARFSPGFNGKCGIPDWPDAIADGTDAMGVIFLHDWHQPGRNAALTPPHLPSGKCLCWIIPVSNYSCVELLLGHRFSIMRLCLHAILRWKLCAGRYCAWNSNFNWWYRMLKFSFLKKTPTPSNPLQVGDVLHSRLDERRMTITEYLTINGISHYRVLIEHGNSRTL